MAKAIALFLLMTVIQCRPKVDEGLLININSGARDCYSYFKISPDLEINPKYANQLSAYLYKNLVDGFECELDQDSMKMLFQRQSFSKSIYLFTLDSTYLTLNHYDNISRWVEGYDNLIRNCSDSLIVYQVTDSLLASRKDNGLNALWNGGAIDKLPHYVSYVKWCIDSGDIGGPIKAVVILHNAQRFAARDSLIEVLKPTSTFRNIETKLLALLKENRSISYELFAEEIYGGV